MDAETVARNEVEPWGERDYVDEDDTPNETLLISLGM